MAIRFQVSGWKGKTAYTLVDDEDYDLLTKYEWRLRKNGYVARYEWSREHKKTLTIFLHKEITNTSPEQWVDHINRDPLDNRRRNLRKCTVSENNQNKEKYRVNPLSKWGSKYIGVKKMWNKWSARISKDREHMYLVLYDTENEAAMAYNEKALELYGENAKLNAIK